MADAKDVGKMCVLGYKGFDPGPGRPVARPDLNYDTECRRHDGQTCLFVKTVMDDEHALARFDDHTELYVRADELSIAPPRP